MNELTAYGFAKLVEENNIVLAFQGMMTNDILALIGKNLQKKHPDQVASKRVFSIVVELAQNINLYSSEKSYSESDKREVGRGIIVISETADFHVVSSGNLIENRNVDDLVNRCQAVNQLSAQELRDYFIEQRRLPEDQDSVGLVEMVRKSGTPLAFEMIDTDNGQTFFALSVKVSKKTLVTD
jgi:Family of unknown function (DUF6272)